MAVVQAAPSRTRDWACLEGRRDLAEVQALVCHGTTCLLPARTPAEVTERLLALPAGA